MTVEFAFGEAGDASQATLDIGLPLLRGESRAQIALAVEPAALEGSLALWRGDGLMVGYARPLPADGLEPATQRTYGAILHASRGLNLYRMWNCVPHINGAGPGGLENYQAFCRGRSMAFESALGKDFPMRLPAASAVGTARDDLTVVFLAGTRPVLHIENPVQVPAYEYPSEHGPRSPSFARATVVGDADAGDVFISGTSAIVGHGTVAPNDTLGQVECTFENLRRISAATGLGDRFGADSGRQRHFKVYLRNAGDLPAVAFQMERRILAPGDKVSYLGADICRAALNVEIEVAVRGSDRI
jgi:chorismate lyase/3-hydroxybenzoate synthase